MKLLPIACIAKGEHRFLELLKIGHSTLSVLMAVAMTSRRAFNLLDSQDFTGDDGEERRTE